MIRNAVVYTPNAKDWVGLYLELCETVFCFAVAIVRAFVMLTLRAVEYVQTWQEWRWFGRLGPVEIGFDLQQQWDDLEVVWFSWDLKGKGLSVYWCRQDGWVKMTW
jgi:hypothetical protein